MTGHCTSQVVLRFDAALATSQGFLNSITLTEKVSQIEQDTDHLYQMAATPGMVALQPPAYVQAAAA